ncbi:MAG: helix-hairpin-helix domain-containing protein [Roseburia sp.]|nr:helix-hairpin-helix domain-containing protein [Roseburia sp.]MCM1242868.1 helix-hairpin-helix domain-containing protein [Roseburia sp.]
MRHINLLKTGILIGIPVLMLSACTGKKDIVLELEAPGNVQEEAAAGETADTAGETGTVYVEGGGLTAEADIIRETQQDDTPAAPAEIYVHICGAVAHPGVYALAPDSRVFEGIAAAGGFREDACEDFINQAMPLQDGQKLTVPTEEEVQAAGEEGIYAGAWISGGITTDAETARSGAENGSAAGNTSKSADGRVNINTATEEELGEIPGIGAGKAAAIVKYRQENGAFASIEDIMKVSGIKEGTYEKIKDKITVDQ